jgi:hypothetical protein
MLRVLCRCLTGVLQVLFVFRARRTAYPGDVESGSVGREGIWKERAMTRRFTLTLAMLVLTLGLLASAAPVSADIRSLGYFYTLPETPGRGPSPEVSTGACLLSGETLSFTDPAGSPYQLMLTGNGYTERTNNAWATCNSTLSARFIYYNGDYYTGQAAFRVTDVTIHGGAHLGASSTLRVSFAEAGQKTRTAYQYNSYGYNGAFDLKIPNTNLVDTGWSTCGNPSLGPINSTMGSTMGVSFGISYTDPFGYSTGWWVGGDDNGKITATFDLEWKSC